MQNHKPHIRKSIAGWAYGITAVVSMVLGGVYLFNPTFMPYHAEALSKSWNALDPDAQVLILALMRVAGGGWFAMGVGLLMLLRFPFRKEQSWAIYALPALILLLK